MCNSLIDECIPVAGVVIMKTAAAMPRYRNNGPIISNIISYAIGDNILFQCSFTL